MVRGTMPVNRPTRSRLSEELKAIPGWALWLGAVVFVVVEALFVTIVSRDKSAPAVWVCFLLGALLGSVLFCYILLISYINRDAGRRGMSRLAWTLVAVLVPNGLGI